MIALNGSCPIESGYIGKIADNECSHGRLPGDRTRPCGCWPHYEYYRDPTVHERAVLAILSAPAITQEAMTLPDEAINEAPFGRKADGTPRKRPRPAWLDDPVRAEAAAAKRRKKTPAAEPAASNGAEPALSQRETGELLQMLDRIEAEFDARITEIDAEEARLREQLAALTERRAAIDADEAQLREQFAALEARRQRLQLGRQAVEVGQRVTV
jgi:hypothetical protein